MIGMKVDQVKGLFFDRAVVADAMDKTTRRAFSKFGAFVRTRARSSIRKRKRVSEPGSPPSSHSGLLRQFIFFAYDPDRKSVVIGPAKLNSVLSPTAAKSLEHGGESIVRSGRREHGETRKVLVRPRPFMQPAFEAELPKAAKLFENSLNK